MGIVLCLLVSDKPIAVVIVHNNIGLEYFSIHRRYNIQLSATHSDSQSVKVENTKAQLQKERVSTVSSLSGNESPTLSAIRRAWRD